MNFLYRLPSVLHDLQHHLCVAVFFWAQEVVDQCLLLMKNTPSVKAGSSGWVRRPSSPSHSDFGQRLVVVTTERADELNFC